MPDSVFLDRVSGSSGAAPAMSRAGLERPRPAPAKKELAADAGGAHPEGLPCLVRLSGVTMNPARQPTLMLGSAADEGGVRSWATSHITLTLERLETESVSSGTCSVSMWLSEVMQMTPDTKATFLVGSAPTCCHTSLLGELRGQPEARAWRLPGSRMHPSPLPSLICIVSP